VQIADQKLQELVAKSGEQKRELDSKYQSQFSQKQALERQLTELENQTKVLKKKR
jgi:predicted phage-related endonuclease